MLACSVGTDIVFSSFNEGMPTTISAELTLSGLSIYDINNFAHIVKVLDIKSKYI